METFETYPAESLFAGQTVWVEAILQDATIPDTQIWIRVDVLDVRERIVEIVTDDGTCSWISKNKVFQRKLG